MANVRGAAAWPLWSALGPQRAASVLVVLLTLLVGVEVHGECQQPTEEAHAWYHSRRGTKPWLHERCAVASDAPVTLVTALMDIGRQQRDGRSLDKYLEWFEHTLRVKTPMVVYLGNASLVDWVKQRRIGQPTLIFHQPLEDSPMYSTVDRVQEIMDSDVFKSHVDAPHRLEVTEPKYIVVIWNKFQWMAEVARHNPFQSRYFFWVDIGSGRWSTVAEGRHWPDMKKVAAYDPHGVALIMQQDRPPTNEPFNVTAFLLGAQHFYMATIMGATGPTWHRVARQAMAFYQHEMLEKGIVATEQHFLRVLAERNNSHVGGVPGGGACPEWGCKGWYNHDINVYDWLADTSTEPQ